MNLKALFVYDDNTKIQLFHDNLETHKEDQRLYPFITTIDRKQLEVVKRLLSKDVVITGMSTGEGFIHLYVKGWNDGTK